MIIKLEWSVLYFMNSMRSQHMFKLSQSHDKKPLRLPETPITFGRRVELKGETRFQDWLFQKVWAGFTCIALYFSKAWSHILARILVYLANYLWYTGTVTTKRSLYKMIEKNSMGQQIYHHANPMKINVFITWGISSLSVWWRGSGRWASAHAPTFFPWPN